MTEVVRPYRGVPAEDRRSLRRAQLMEACLDVVGDAGVAGTTVDAVCARAGLSKRYFYESFADREAVLAEALDGLLGEVREVVGGELAAEDDDAAARVRRAVSAVVQILSADPRAARLYIEAPRHAVLERRRSQAFDQFGALLAEHLLDAGADDPRARALALIIVAGTTELLGRWLAGELALGQEELVDTVTWLGLSARGRP